MKQSPLTDIRVVAMNRSEHSYSRPRFGTFILAAIIVVGAMTGFYLSLASAEDTMMRDWSRQLQRNLDRNVEIQMPDNINYEAERNPYNGNLEIPYSEMERVRVLRETLYGED